MPLIHEGRLLYQGDSTFQESESARAVIDDYGLDELTRTFTGRPSLVDEFIRRYPPGTPDTAFPTLSWMPPRNPGMTRIGAPAIDKARAWTSVTFQLAGKMGVTPSEPLTRKVDSWQEDTVQLQTVTVQVIVDYKAPTTTYEWCSQTRPEQPRYANGALQVGQVEIIRKRGVASLNGTVFGPVNTFCVVEQRLNSFTREQVGTWWRCSESWMWVIVPQRTFFSPDQRTILIAG